MPKFLQDGPDVPDTLVHLHEEGQVVFFCGAGISYPADLPNFEKLVTDLYTELGTRFTPIENQAFCSHQYDATLELLERRHPGGREVVRASLYNVLRPKLRRKGATATHTSLVDLATDEEGKVRLVTTNFDRIFPTILRSRKPAINLYSAPLLPIPKSTRWNGIVHLHGLLTPAPDRANLNSLVLSSGDFGNAYLVERWASRFVSELFRLYTVCFVGYSINDPVLRYMMDALAADEMQGEQCLKMYAFGGYPEGKEEAHALEWQSKNVIPILYNDKSRHILLHETLRKWGSTYRDGVLGRKMIITRHAKTPPTGIARDHFDVDQVLWALTDKKERAVKHFADLNPAPPLEWLGPLTAELFKHEDLIRFRVSPDAEKDSKLKFTMLCRPAPYRLSPRMTLFSTTDGAPVWDETMRQLARWLSRHLGDPELFLILVSTGGTLHVSLRDILQMRLDEIQALADSNNHEAIQEICLNAPKAIPNQSMKILWRLLLSGRVKSSQEALYFHDWVDRFKIDGLSASMQLVLRDLLAPRVQFRRAFRMLDEDAEKEQDSDCVHDIVRSEITLRCNFVFSSLQSLRSDPRWNASQHLFLSDFTLLLRDALDLMNELGEADDKWDNSHIARVAIRDHEQNNDFQEWTALIVFARDAWLATARIHPEMARQTAQQWFDTPYPIFKRLAFFAAANGNTIDSSKALDWLLSQDRWWLWSSETKCEAFSLLEFIGGRILKKDKTRLENGILAGPPRKMYKAGLDKAEWCQIVDRSVWVRLAKMKSWNIPLGAKAASRLRDLSKSHVDWKLRSDERDEFPVWFSSGEDCMEYDLIPNNPREIANYLRQEQGENPWKSDNWEELCRHSIDNVARALQELSDDHIWPVTRWNNALHVWSRPDSAVASWDLLVPLVSDIPSEVLENFSHSVASWLFRNAPSLGTRTDDFFALTGICLRRPSRHLIDADKISDPVTDAVNSTAGIATHALVAWWQKNKLEPNNKLEGRTRDLFTKICTDTSTISHQARVVIAMNAIPLFQADEEWTFENLVPIFDWSLASNETAYIWEGFLAFYKPYKPFLFLIRQPLVATAHHFEELPRWRGRYAELLTVISLEMADLYSQDELTKAIDLLPSEGLNRCLTTISQFLDAADAKRSAFWTNRCKPFFRNVWPKSNGILSEELTIALGRVLFATGPAFPDALDTLRAWLIPIEHGGHPVHGLLNGGFCEEFPSESLELLGLVINEQSRVNPEQLRQCLQKIGAADESLRQSTNYRRLSAHRGVEGLA